MEYCSKLVGHGVVATLLAWLTYIVLTTKALWFLDGVNLIFHEAGHAILFWAPEFVTVLGGTLGQLAIPVVCAFAFWRERKRLSTLLMVWWAGQNLVNISVYMSDARAQVLPLLGGDGVGHDWAYLFGTLNLLPYDTTIGMFVFWIGGGCMLYAVMEIGVHVWEAWSHRFHR